MRNIICITIFPLLALIGSVSLGLSAEAPQDLLFSKYIEGSSYNKALEIFNGTQDAVDLSGYEINAYHNGNVEPTYTIKLQGLLLAGEVFIICNPDAGQAIVDLADMTAPGINFNGDDAITLNHLNGDVVDAIGQIGMDPGSQWGSGVISTQDNSLFRLDAVCSGDTNALDDFDPAMEWAGSAKDDITGLGAHMVDCTIALPEAVGIHEVQGSGSASPMDGQLVTIEGIVIGDFQESDELKGFFIQEEDEDADSDTQTSEGVFIYNNSYAVEVGDKVRLSGTVGEYYDNTQVKSLSALEIISSGNDLPSPAEITLPFSDAAFMERYEGMYAIFSQSLTVTENYNLGRYGEMVLSNGRLQTPTNVVFPGDDSIALQARNDLNRIVLDDGSTIQNPDPITFPEPGLSADNTVRSGDTVQNLTGVIYYSYRAYRVQPTEPPVFEQSNPRMAAPEHINGSLKVASFNVLNYFTTIDDAECPYSAGCRGADNLEELARQKAKIVEAMATIEADIFGLMELENHPGDEALHDLVEGLNEMVGPNAYGYIATGAIGGDAIKVALVYKTATVTPVGLFAILDSTVDPRFIDTKNRPSLAQTFMEIETGEQLTIVVNHLKSKGSDCNELGDPDIGDGQGNCNLTRTYAAQAMADWLESDPTQSGDPDFLVIGDMNAYAMEDPISVFTDRDYTNLIDNFTGPDAYSYIFYGQAGYLDHALSNPTLTPQVKGVTEWHINCDEPRVLNYNTEYKSEGQITDLYAETAYRASDHDPVIVGLDLKSYSTSTQCANLGNNRYKRVPDADVFKFQGKKGEEVSIELLPNMDNGASDGKRAMLMLVDAIRGQRLFKVNRGQLPSQIKATLPADGTYMVTVSELLAVKKKKRFKGDYCLSLTSKSDLTLKPARWVE